MKPLACVLCLIASVWGTLYLPEWDSLDSRPIPAWFDNAKFGIFIHFGVFSVPGFGNEWFWKHWQDANQTKKFENYADFMRKNYPPGFKYQDFAQDFKAEFFDPTEWVELIAAAGAQYTIITSKHHDGYTLWPSKFSPGWNSMEKGPKRDILGEFSAAVKKKAELKLGIYYSMFEWYNPTWLKDKANNFTTTDFAQFKVLPEMKDLVQRFEPDILWTDGQWEAPDWYWNAKEFLAWLYNESRVRNSVVTTDRWGNETRHKHGGVFTYTKYKDTESIKNSSHKWEVAMSLDRQSYSFRKEVEPLDILTSQQVIEKLVITVSKGGNLLLGVGPSEEGMITPIYEEVLRELGRWFKVNGEAIYGTRQSTFLTDSGTKGVWYTKKGVTVYYAFILKRPGDNVVRLKRPIVGENNTLTLLGCNEEIVWSRVVQGVEAVLPEEYRCPSAPQPWVLKLSHVINGIKKPKPPKKKSLEQSKKPKIKKIINKKKNSKVP